MSCTRAASLKLQGMAAHEFSVSLMLVTKSYVDRVKQGEASSLGQVWTLESHNQPACFPHQLR